MRLLSCFIAFGALAALPTFHINLAQAAPGDVTKLVQVAGGFSTSAQSFRRFPDFPRPALSADGSTLAYFKVEPNANEVVLVDVQKPLLSNRNIP